MSLYLLLSFVFALAGLTQECIINQHTCSIHQVTDGTGLVCQFAPECGEYEGDRRMRGVKNITLTLTSILQGGINLTDALFPDLGVVEVFTANGREEICSSLITARDVAVFVDGRMCEEVSFSLLVLILCVPSTIFQLNMEGSSWVEPVLS